MDTGRKEVEKLIAEWRAIEMEAVEKIDSIKARLSVLLNVDAPIATTKAATATPLPRVAPKPETAKPKWRLVLDVMADHPQVDSATVAGALNAADRGATREDDLAMVRAQFDYLSRHKHFIEKIDGKRGWWHLTPAGRAELDGASKKEHAT
jgi:hypothetical protein